VDAFVSPSFDWCPTDWDGVKGESEESGGEEDELEESKLNHSSCEGPRTSGRAKPKDASDSEDTQVDEELQNYFLNLKRERRPAEESAATTATPTSTTPVGEKRPRLKRQRSKPTFNVFKLENNWLKYEESEDDESSQDAARPGSEEKFSVYIGDSSLSLSLSPSGSPPPPAPPASSPPRPIGHVALAYEEDEKRLTDDDDDNDGDGSMTLPRPGVNEAGDERRKRMKGDPLFHALFRKTEDRSVCERRPTKRPDSHSRALLAASARQHAGGQGKDATDRADAIIMPTTSSSSLSPLRDSPEREIFESFSQLYDLTEPTEGSDLGKLVSQPRASEERGGSQSDEEDFSQHLALDWAGSPAGRGKRKARIFGYAQH
jgi:hypothetical protein